MKARAQFHQDTPAGWYYKSIKVDLLQRYWHKRRFKEIEKLLERTAGNILDIGCADGVFSKVVFDKTKAKQLTGIDIAPTSIQWANKHWKNKNLRFLIGKAENLEFQTSSFDAVFALEVLEHLSSPQKVLREIKRVMKNGGYGILLVPTDSLLFQIIWFTWLHFYPRGYVWRGTHIQSFKNGNLAKICRKVGLKVEIKKNFLLGMLQVIKVRK